MESIAAKVASDRSSIASARRNANGSCSLATSPNLLRCHQGRSWPFWRIAGFTSVRSAASTVFCMPMPSSPARPGTVTTVTLVMINSLLAATRSGLAQPATTGKRIQVNYVCHGRLNSSRGVIFPDMRRYRMFGFLGKHAMSLSLYRRSTMVARQRRLIRPIKLGNLSRSPFSVASIRKYTNQS